jgi:DNA-binding NarL/FixJ family response regulator
MRLSPKQKQVLELIVQGKTNREIAGSLHIGRRTVEEHRAEIYRRLEVHNVVDLVKKTLGVTQ